MIDDDTDQAAWHQKEMDERHAREDAALERARVLTEELWRIYQELAQVHRHEHQRPLFRPARAERK